MSSGRHRSFLWSPLPFRLWHLASAFPRERSGRLTPPRLVGMCYSQQSNPVLPWGFLYPRENTANPSFPLSLSPVLVSRISLVRWIALASLCALVPRGFYLRVVRRVSHGSPYAHSYKPWSPSLPKVVHKVLWNNQSHAPSIPMALQKSGPFGLAIFQENKKGHAQRNARSNCKHCQRGLFQMIIKVIV